MDRRGFLAAVVAALVGPKVPANVNPIIPMGSPLTAEPLWWGISETTYPRWKPYRAMTNIPRRLSLPHPRVLRISALDFPNVILLPKPFIKRWPS